MKLTEKECEEAISLVERASDVIDPDSEDGERDFDACNAAELATDAREFLKKIKSLRR